jgi:hypothetical protein
MPTLGHAGTCRWVPAVKSAVTSRPVLDTEQFTNDLLDVLLAGFTA